MIRLRGWVIGWYSSSVVNLGTPAEFGLREVARAQSIKSQLAGAPVVALGAGALGFAPRLISEICCATAPDQARPHVERNAVAVVRDGAPSPNSTRQSGPSLPSSSTVTRPFRNACVSTASRLLGPGVLDNDARHCDGGPTTTMSDAALRLNRDKLSRV
jgi:hypothetical protein